MNNDANFLRSLNNSGLPTRDSSRTYDEWEAANEAFMNELNALHSTAEAAHHLPPKSRSAKKRKYKFPPSRAKELNESYNYRKSIQKQGSPSLEGIKKTLRSENKKEMEIGQFYYCDSCKNPIYNHADGFIIHGNVYVADPSMRGGLIGNNFPDVKPGTKIEITDVKENVLCKMCLLKALKSPSPSSSDHIIINDSISEKEIENYLNNSLNEIDGYMEFRGSNQ